MEEKRKLNFKILIPVAVAIVIVAIIVVVKIGISSGDNNSNSKSKNKSYINRNISEYEYYYENSYIPKIDSVISKDIEMTYNSSRADSASYKYTMNIEKLSSDEFAEIIHAYTKAITNKSNDKYICTNENTNKMNENFAGIMVREKDGKPVATIQFMSEDGETMDIWVIITTD